MIEADAQFEDEETNVEDQAIQTVMVEKLKERMGLLCADELEMIYALFYQDLSEQEYAKHIGILRKP